MILAGLVMLITLFKLLLSVLKLISGLTAITVVLLALKSLNSERRYPLQGICGLIDGLLYCMDFQGKRLTILYITRQTFNLAKTAMP